MQTRIWKNVEIVYRIFDFAYESVKNQNIKPDFQGARKDIDIFVNLFQGKIAELAVLLELKKEGFPVSTNQLDLTLRGRGNWDNGDIILKNKYGQDVYIDVKSIKGNSSNLLIETCRFNKDGSLSYENCDGTKHYLDAYALVRVDFSKNLFSYDFSKIEKETFFEDLEIRTTFIGSITLKDFWEKKKFVPRGTICGKNNFNRIWNGQPFEKVEDERIITAENKRTYCIQTDNYMVPFHILGNVHKVYRNSLEI